MRQDIPDISSPKWLIRKTQGIYISISPGEGWLRSVVDLGDRCKQSFAKCKRLQPSNSSPNVRLFCPAGYLIPRC
jgi:hypothetical protein